MKRWFHARKLGRKTKILLGAGLAVALALALFDWNWLRGPLEGYLSRESGREVKIGHLHLALGLNPTLRVRGFHVQNAPWADSRPLIDAGEASFTFSLRSLWDERTVVSRIVLIDADVDLEKQADGLRNWRLVDPDYRGPPKVKVLALEAHRSKLRFANRGVDLDMTAAASEPGPAAAGRQDQRQFPTRIDFSGSYRKTKFSGTALTGELLTFRESGVSFPLLGHMQWAGTRIDVDGTVADIWEPSAIDAKVRMAGPSLANLHPFFRFRLPATRPYKLAGQVKQSDTETTSASLHGKIGETDAAGEGSYSRTEPRSMLRAALRSDSAHLSDFIPAPGARPADAGRIFSAQKFDATRLSANDAQVTLAAKKLTVNGPLLLQNLRLTAALENGVLHMKSIDFGLAGGSVAGSLTLEARQGQISSQALADFRKLRLESLFPETAAKSRSSGLIDGRLKLAGRGDSIAALLGNASGSFDASMGRGRISNLADAKLALSGGKILALKLRGDQDIEILCAAIGLDFRNGSGRSRTLMLDTEQTRTDGAGSVDLRAERFDFLLKPRPKKPGFLSLGASVRIEGSFRNANFSIARNGGEAAPVSGGSCAGPAVAGR